MKKRTKLPIFLAGVATAGVLYRYGEEWLRELLLYLSGAGWARESVTAVPLAHQVANRFVAGETIARALEATRELNKNGMLVTLDYLGESVEETAVAIQARNQIITLLDRIAESGVEAGVSIKLSQLGLKLGQQLALDNARRILDRAKKHGNFIRIDMEESAMTDATLSIYHKLRDEEGYKNIGIVIQAYLYRSEADVQQLIDDGASVRLCKGAYAEPETIAFPEKGDTDTNYIRLMQLMFGKNAQENGLRLAIASHDERMIQATMDYANLANIEPSEFEFQMLYGVRRELQKQLVEKGYQVRVYIPYGEAWYPYFTRRLAERPANLWFFMSNFFRS